MAEIGSRVVFGAPKHTRNERVPVPAFLAERLAVHIAGRDPEAFVFAAPRGGGVLRNKDFRRRYFDPPPSRGPGSGSSRRTSARYVGLTPHELRHTAASLAIASGATIKAVQTMLGHASARRSRSTSTATCSTTNSTRSRCASTLTARAPWDFSRTRAIGEVVELRPAYTASKSLFTWANALAEGLGFEPRGLSPNGFQDRPIRPLRHPSGNRRRHGGARLARRCAAKPM